MVCADVQFRPVLQNGMHEISWDITDPCLNKVGGGPYCFKQVANPELPPFFHPLYPNVPGYSVITQLLSVPRENFPKDTIVKQMPRVGV